VRQPQNAGISSYTVLIRFSFGIALVRVRVSFYNPQQQRICEDFTGLSGAGSKDCVAIEAWNPKKRIPLVDALRS
jgi:hypothetical protein